jgi:hypothetical protein
MKRLIPLLIWLYRRLLLLYPASFRELFAEEMEEVYRRALEEDAERRSWRALWLLVREVRELPLGLFAAYRRHRAISLSLQEASYSIQDVIFVPTRLERAAIRLQPWVWGMVVMAVATSALYTLWLFAGSAYSSYRGAPLLAGTSAILLEDRGDFVRLPQGAISCVAVEGKNEARCTANVANEVLHLTLTIDSLGKSGSYSGSCRASFAGGAVNCLQLFTRAKDRTMPPVTVARPRAITDAQWQALMGTYVFTLPSGNGVFQWGFAANVVLSLLVVFVIWGASPSTPMHVGANKFLRKFIPSTMAGILFFLPMAWLALLLSFGLEDWIERF